MIKTSIERAPISSERFSWWSRWPQWISYAAALWSLLYGVLGLYWMSGGEVFPIWMPGLAGKRVPPALAIIPASLVSILALQTGLGIDRHALMGTFAFASAVPGTYVPLLFWPLWGLALGAATLAYYYRRRGRCKHCGRL